MVLNRLTTSVFDAITHSFHIAPETSDGITTAAGREANQGATEEEHEDRFGSHNE